MFPLPTALFAQLAIETLQVRLWNVLADGVFGIRLYLVQQSFGLRLRLRLRLRIEQSNGKGFGATLRTRLDASLRTPTGTRVRTRVGRADGCELRTWGLGSTLGRRFRQRLDLDLAFE
jgi:hypothetical protein